MRLIAMLAALLFLQGCVDRSTVVVVGCPAVVEYSAAVQAKAKAELDALPPGSMLARFMDDYSQVRDQLRKCVKH